MLDEEKRPRPQEIYRHFKGNFYQIITLAEDTETGDTLVIYQALYGTYRIWSRKIENFLEKLDPEKYPNAGQTYRFEKVTDYKNGAEGNGTSNQQCEVKMPVAEKTTELDPLVERFLDAGSTGERLDVLAAMRTHVTNDMIDICAMAAGVEIDPGSPEERWIDLKECLLTIDRYEQSRSRYNG